MPFGPSGDAARGNDFKESLEISHKGFGDAISEKSLRQFFCVAYLAQNSTKLAS